MGYIAYVLDERSKKKLLEAHPPMYGNIKAHHITLKFGVSKEALHSVRQEFGYINYVSIIGYACDENTDCVAVVTDTGRGQRFDGTTLHVTISIADGASAIMAGKTAELVSGFTSTHVLTGSIKYIEC